MAEVIRFRLNIISLYGAKKELTYRIQTVLNATIIKVLYWLFFNDSPRVLITSAYHPKLFLRVLVRLPSPLSSRST
ncbi:hypothetical protein BU56_13235 [Escherichia coli O145:H25 str. 07-3858]|nr:hypothetical protein BU56_13235 [Escherichia coli O145:H25 str. 07-3858]